MTVSNEVTRRPTRDEYNEYYHKYISLVDDRDVLVQLATQIDELKSVFAQVSDEEAEKLHPPFTWSLKQVLGHMIDTERVFGSRMHHFASGDFQPLPGMDQDAYVVLYDYKTSKLNDLIEELGLCRRANCMLIDRFRPGMWDHRGIASGFEVTVRALVYKLVGHINHHLNIIRSRLGK